MNPTQLKVDLPEGVAGKYKIEKFQVDPERSENTRLRALMKGRGFVPPGEYTRLIRETRDPFFPGQVIWMTDTPDEYYDLSDFLFSAQGHILIAGLGIGLVIDPLMNNEAVKSVTVLEIEPDIIQLVGSIYLKRYPYRLEIIQADAVEWDPEGRKFDCAWIDIWGSICSDNLPGMENFLKRYGKFCKSVKIWSFDETKRLRY